MIGLLLILAFPEIFNTLVNEDFEFQPYMMLFLGLTMLVMGLREFQKGQKDYGWLSIVVFIFILFVSFKSFLLK
nr:YczI family protein [Neobacillus bataviensis]